MKRLFFIFLFLMAVDSYSENTKNPVEKNLSHYLWPSRDGKIKVHFVCNTDNQLEISITITGSQSLVKGQVATIKVETAYSPIVGEENDIRVAHINGAVAKDKETLIVRNKYIKLVINSLNRVHQQAIQNEQLIRQDYEKKIEYCRTLKTEESEQRCYRGLGVYMTAGPSITLKFTDYIIRPAKLTSKNWSFIGQFDAVKFKTLKALSCYE